MSDWPITVNSDYGLIAAINRITDWYHTHKYITIDEPRIGPDRSLDQNALFHVWLTEAAAYYLSKPIKEVTPTDVESMKITVKRHYYAETGAPFMIEKVQDVWRNKTKEAYTSSKRWKRGEMFNVLTWFQMRAANDGLILESKGEFNKLQREQTK